MPNRALETLRAMAHGAWRTVDVARRVVVNLIFVAVLVVALALLFRGGGRPDVPDGAALYVKPVGALVEQLTGDPLDRAIDEVRGRAVRETLVRDVVEAIERGATDERIAGLVLDLDEVGTSWLSRVRVVRDAIETFRASGKPVVATADSYTRDAYYLAAHADEATIHPMGWVLLDGYGVYRNFYREAIEKYGIDVEVFRAGEFKSAVEPYLRDEMSPGVRANLVAWLEPLWGAFCGDVERARGLHEGAVDGYAETLAERLSGEQRSAAVVAVQAGLVDRVATRSDVREMLHERFPDPDDDDPESYLSIGMHAYLEATDADPPDADAEIAVVVARGEIVGGSQPPGTIGSETLARSIRRARDDENVAALVVRIDSGGGSTFASELVRRELLAVRDAGKPVVVSMASVAASGAYWIATAADRIVAHPTTITGSIGVYGLYTSFEGTMELVGLHTDGVGTTPLAGAMRNDRRMPEPMRRVLRARVERTYLDFLERVSEARGLPLDTVRTLAEGRVWSGEQALDVGLVDELGGRDDAVARAAELAGLEEGGYKTRDVEPPTSWRDELLVELVSRSGRVVGPVFTRRTPAWLETVASRLDDPTGVYALSFIPLDGDGSAE